MLTFEYWNLACYLELQKWRSGVGDLTSRTLTHAQYIHTSASDFRSAFLTSKRLVLISSLLSTFSSDGRAARGVRGRGDEFWGPRSEFSRPEFTRHPHQTVVPYLFD